MFLGFYINSVNRTVKLTTEKKNSLHEACNDLLLHKTQSIRRVAQVIGTIVSGLPGVKYGVVIIEIWKGRKYLQLNQTRVLPVWHCWKRLVLTFNGGVQTFQIEITKGSPSLTTKTDVCETGWGAVCKGMRTDGQFSLNKQQLYVNVSELLDSFFGLKSLWKVLIHMQKFYLTILKQYMV